MNGLGEENRDCLQASSRPGPPRCTDTHRTVYEIENGKKTQKHEKNHHERHVVIARSPFRSFILCQFNWRSMSASLLSALLLPQAERPWRPRPVVRVGHAHGQAHHRQRGPVDRRMSWGLVCITHTHRDAARTHIHPSKRPHKTRTAPRPARPAPPGPSRPGGGCRCRR